MVSCDIMACDLQANADNLKVEHNIQTLNAIWLGVELKRHITYYGGRIFKVFV